MILSREEVTELAGSVAGALNDYSGTAWRYIGPDDSPSGEPEVFGENAALIATVNIEKRPGWEPFATLISKTPSLLDTAEALYERVEELEKAARAVVQADEDEQMERDTSGERSNVWTIEQLRQALNPTESRAADAAHREHPAGAPEGGKR